VKAVHENFNSNYYMIIDKGTNIKYINDNFLGSEKQKIIHFLFASKSRTSVMRALL